MRRPDILILFCILYIRYLQTSWAHKSGSAPRARTGNPSPEEGTSTTATEVVRRAIPHREDPDRADRDRMLRRRGRAPPRGVGPCNRVREALAAAEDTDGLDLSITAASGSLPGTTDGAECLVVVLSRPPSAPPDWLRSLPELLPTVLITPDPPSTALALRSVRITEIIGQQEFEEDPMSLLERAVSTTLLGRARSVIRHAPGLSGLLRAWMFRVLDAFPPYGSIRASVEDVGRSSSTLRRHWRRAIGRSRPLTFLRWGLLVRAFLIKSPGRGWNDVAVTLGVTRRRLERAAADLPGVRLGPLAAKKGRQLREAYEAYLTRMLL